MQAAQTSPLTPPSTSAEPRTTVSSLSPEMTALMARVVAARQSANFQEELQEIFQKVDETLRSARAQVRTTAVECDPNHPADGRLSVLHARYPGMVDAPFKAIALRSLLVSADLSKIPGALAQTKEDCAKAAEVLDRVALDINKQKVYLCQSVDGYNRWKLFCKQMGSDADVLAQLPLLKEMEEFARLAESLPDTVADPAKVGEIHASAEKVEAKVKGLHEKLCAFQKLCEQMMETPRDEFKVFENQSLAPVPNIYLLTQGQVEAHYTPVWNERAKKTADYLNEMVMKWHQSLIRLWLIQHHVDYCSFTNELRVTLDTVIRPELIALDQKAGAFVTEQTVRFNIQRLREDPEGLHNALKSVQQKIDLFKVRLEEFDSKRQQFSDWLALKSPLCVFTSLDQRGQIEAALAKLHSEIETRFFHYRGPVIQQWHMAAGKWNVIALKMRQLQNFIEQHDLTAEADLLVTQTASLLSLMQTQLAKFEQEQKQNFAGELFKQRLQGFVGDFQQYSLSKWRALELIDHCRVPPVEEMIAKERIRYLILTPEEDKAVVAEYSRMSSEHERSLSTQKTALKSKWDSMEELGRSLSAKLKHLTTVSEQGGFQSKNPLESVLKKLSSSSFVDTWSERPKARSQYESFKGARPS